MVQKMKYKHNQYSGLSANQRFWEKVDVRGEDDCWIWMASRDSCNYGMFYPKEYPNGIKASRYSWKIHNGEIPKGIYVCHTCDNPPCVNPKHLFLGTQKDNMQDMVQKGRIYDRHGERNSKAKLTEYDVRRVKQLRDNGKTYKGIAEELGVSEGCINHILNGRHWSWVN